MRGAILVCTAAAISGCADRQSDQSEEATDSSARPITPWFTEITPQVALDFVYQTGGKGKLYLPEIMGAGSALFDFDGDGDLDIYVLNR